uniref:F-box/FBD/LRR-repeat protein At1g13570-like n=2 Tax=Nicotiana sylvestris TaxID=4096 RepID=A0A1U7WUA7_NICSY
MSPHRSKIKQSDTSQESIDDDDIISDLPGNVIDCILGKMPIRDAIRTSILSKKWRLNYSTIPQLVFDDQFCKELVDFANKKCAPEFSEYELKYHLEEIISKSLMLHPGRIEKFKVCIPNFTTTSVPDVNKWILYLSRKNIKTISLKYMTSIVHHKLPPYFFSCLHLTYLKLLNIHISPPPPEFKGFLNLYKVLLSRVHFGSNCLESFLCSCPVLRALELYWCSGIRHFNISGSKLKKLRIKAYDKFKSISLENAPNLNEVSVMLERVVIGNPNSDLVKFVGSLPKVKTIRVNGMCLKLLAKTPVPPILWKSPDFLKVIELKGLKFIDFKQISAAVCLIRSALNLQELYIEASTAELNQEQVSGYLKFLDCSTFPLKKLHLVKLTNISGFDPEFEFIWFLLFSSPSLVTMSIVEHPKLGVKEAQIIRRK